jgi:organic radical activating enzyme
VERKPVSEIFCAVQGEGPYVGARQAFVRFVGCNLDCSYCDTPLDEPDHCLFEKVPGSGEFEKLSPLLCASDIEEKTRAFNNLHSVSLTGGEPLLHAEFIRELNLPAPVYLETNMTLPEKAAIVKDSVDYVAGDVKLPEEFEGSNFVEHIERTYQCFRTLRSNQHRDCFCKIVVTSSTKPADVMDVVAQISDYISCVVLQPVTQHTRATDIQTILSLQENLLEIKNTLIIPQTHKMWGCL